MKESPVEMMEQHYKLLFYSDQVVPANRRIDTFITELAGKDAPSVAYIPSHPSRFQRFFEEKRTYYAEIGITDVRAFPIDHDFSATELNQLFGCDVLHLSGGDTFAFLRELQRRRLISHIREFAKKGVIVGTSAGAILMTPNIEVNRLYGEDASSDLLDLSALALVPFEFFAHLTDENLPLIRQYSRSHPTSVIYAARNGDGVVISGTRVIFVGSVLKIVDGNICLANEVRGASSP